MSLCVRVYGCDFQTKSVLLRGEICMCHATRYATATTGININKCIISLLKQTDNELSKDARSELKTKLQGIKTLETLRLL